MKGNTPPPAMGDSNAQRRRSPRLTSPPLATVNAYKMAPPGAVKRSIVVRKIAPRKTTLLSDHDKENVHHPPEENGTKKTKISTPDPGAQGRRKAAMPSPILATSPPHLAAPLPPPPPTPPPTAAPEDVLWSNKVRRSYSRLSDQSFRSPNPRDDMFGFEKLSTPEVFPRKALSRSGAEGSCASLSGLGSFTSLMDAEEECAEPDLNIPGVMMVKEKRRRKKVQKIDVVEMDSLAAKMNAEFEEAEGFELFVE